MSDIKVSEVDQFRSAVVTAAAASVVAEMTPERQRALVIEILNKGLAELGNTYGPLSQEIGKLAKVEMGKILLEDDVMEDIKRAVRKGVMLALEKLPEQTKTKVVDECLSAVANAVKSRDRY